jgi:hypothetical protein
LNATICKFHEYVFKNIKNKTKSKNTKTKNQKNNSKIDFKKKIFSAPLLPVSLFFVLPLPSSLFPYLRLQNIEQ